MLQMAICQRIESKQVIQELVNNFTSTAKATEYVHSSDQIKTPGWVVTEIQLLMPVGHIKQSMHDPQEELNIITLTNEQLALFFPITTRATLDF